MLQHKYKWKPVTSTTEWNVGPYPDPSPPPPLPSPLLSPLPLSPSPLPSPSPPAIATSVRCVYSTAQDLIIVWTDELARICFPRLISSQLVYLIDRLNVVGDWGPRRSPLAPGELSNWSVYEVVFLSTLGRSLGVAFPAQRVHERWAGDTTEIRFSTAGRKAECGTLGAVPSSLAQRVLHTKTNWRQLS